MGRSFRENQQVKTRLLLRARLWDMLEGDLAVVVPFIMAVPTIEIDESEI